MAKEVLIYGEIYSWTASSFINKMNEFADNENIAVRIATDGGDPEYGWSILAKMAENKDRTQVKVDGKAYSMGAFACCYVEEVEALDVSEFLIHRAAYPEWREKDLPEAYLGNLKRINASLETAFRNKVDVEKFEKLKGVTVDEIFSMDSRVDVFLNAKEAKSIGLISKINKITPEKQASIQANRKLFEVQYSEDRIAACFPKTAQKSSEQNKVIDTVMDINELKEKHPELYAQVAESGKAAATEAGKKAEQARVAAWSEWADVDAEMVKKAIAEGTEMTTTHLSALSKKALTSGYAAKALKEMEEGSEGGLATDEEKSVAKTAKEKELEEWDAKFKAALKLEKA